MNHEDQPAEPGGSDSEKTSVGGLVPVDPAFKARIYDLVQRFPDRYGDLDKPVPPDDLDEQRQIINRQAWESSLAASDVTGLAGWRLDNLEPDQQPQNLRKLVQSLTSPNPPVRNLVLAGAVGAGKTTAAIAVGWASLEAGLSVRFVEHSKYLMWLRPDSMPTSGPYKDVTAKQLRTRMRASDLLILDDLAASLDPTQPATQHARDETLTLVGDRIDTEGRVTVITTNHTSEALERMFGSQFLSRLSKRGARLIFTGVDKRGQRLSW